MAHILVVEDSRTQRHLITHWLMTQQFTVTAVGNGLDALKEVRKELPDVIILDVIMPHLNGYEVCRFLKNNRRTQAIQVILCSTQDSLTAQSEGLDQGADAYLCKPFKPRQLLQTIRRLLHTVEPIA